MTVPYELQFAYAEEDAHHPSWPHARYKASFFGPFRVMLDEQPLGEPTWRRNKARALLKWFLLNPGDLFSVDQLSRLFWPDITLNAAISNLHVTIHYLRHVLESSLAPGRPSSFIRRNRHNYYWFELNDVWWTDVLEVQYLSKLVKEAERVGEIPKMMRLYSQLLAHYNLKFLPEDIYEDVFASYRRQHDYAHVQLLSQAMHLYMQAGQLDDALACAMQILSVDPYNEDAVKTLVGIHMHQGNTTGAIRQIDNFQRFLKQDLGVEPGEDILNLRKNILASR